MRQKQAVDPFEVPSLSVTVLYTVKLLVSVAVYLLLRNFWGRYMLTDFRELEGHGFVAAGLRHVWFIFAWAFGVTFLTAFILRRRRTIYISRITQVLKGLWLSVNAGWFEEIIFRGFMFLNAMVTLVFMNWLTGWIVSGGLIKWLYVHWLVPLANWATFHALQPQLMGHHNWAFGAAIVSVTVAFRDEHKYLGPVGWINSWFFGMVMFYLVFNYGLLTAIVAHAVYDAIIFTIDVLASKRETVRMTHLRHIFGV